MKIEEIKSILDSKLSKQLVPARILLDKFRIIEENSRKTSAYTDPSWAPFYYYLGSIIKPRNVLEIGFKLGLLSGAFFKGCNTVEKFLGFQEQTEDYYSFRLGRANIKSCYKKEIDLYLGQLTDEDFLNKIKGNLWDLVMVNEQKDYDYYRMCLDLVWERTSSNGFILMDYAIAERQGKKAFSDFCKIKNREKYLFKTRYGTGIVQK